MMTTIIILLLILATAASIQKRTFAPVTRYTQRKFPSAIKVNGTYYVVATNFESIFDSIPIYTSTDLNNWTEAGYVFNTSNRPLWMDQYSPCYNPRIHKIGSNYQVYFSTTDGIGVALAAHPLGPYTAIDRPMSLPDGHFGPPNILNDGDKLYLLYKGESSIEARELTSNGLNIASNKTNYLLDPNLSWETAYLSSPWYMRRGDYHYLFYTGGMSCIDHPGVGVARSSNAMGPYQKLPSPIIAPNFDYVGMTHASIVKDLDEKNDVIFYNGDVFCGNAGHCFLLSPLSWDEKDWPYIGNC